jgi:hypothetical protein
LEALQIGDRATGTRVLLNLYEEMKDKPVLVDLDALWADLGVRVAVQKVRFDEGAPFAAIRHAITGDSGWATASVSREQSKILFAGRTARRPRLSK